MKNPKVAIMTWYTYPNYGTVLQASALYKTIQSFGFPPDLIRYTPRVREEEKKKYTAHELAKKLKRKIKYIYEKPCISEGKKQLFTEFVEEKTTQTKPCRAFAELAELNKEYDAFVCGSDQIWSPLCFDDKYFLPFVECAGKMIAYAPSFGVPAIKSVTICNEIRRNISRFSHLSARETSGVQLIRDVSGKNAELVLDPTLLLTASEWDEFVDIEKAQKIKDKKYILCYFLGDASQYMGCVQSISRELKIPFYIIPMTTKQRASNNVVPFEVGPREFVSLIKNAEYVCTDSFHGMAFSINYNVPFSAFKRFAEGDSQNQNTRIESLLHLLGLENRLLDHRKRHLHSDEVQCAFEEANVVLENYRCKSLDFLKEALYSAAEFPVEQERGEYRITKLCCGCGACEGVCPQKAITTKLDGEGFQHYSIDQEKCIHCGKCKTVCPMNEIAAVEVADALGLFSLKSNSAGVLEKSSSGGAGFILAEKLQKEGCCVCGCAYIESENGARHILVHPEEDKLGLLQGSKYIQSVSNKAITEVAQIAKKKRIAFFGTPCQAAALDKILRKTGVRDNAILVDLICHGVPTRFLWTKYLYDLDKKYGIGKNPRVVFRNKKNGWKPRLLRVYGEETYERDEHRDDFYAFFRRGLCNMRACYDCPYRERSSADLRIGDYWGGRFEKDNQGVSMMIANTAEGLAKVKELIIEDTCFVEQHDLSEYWSVQFPYNTLAPIYREELITALKNEESSLEQLRKEYCSYYDTCECISGIKKRIKKAMGWFGR